MTLIKNLHHGGTETRRRARQNLETQRNGGSGGKEFLPLMTTDDTDSGSGGLVIRVIGRQG
jgi:hypothetical protein